MSKRAPSVIRIERHSIGNLGSALDTARPAVGSNGGERTGRRTPVGSNVVRLGHLEGGSSVDHALLRPLLPA